MRLPRDPRFLAEEQAFALRHTCEDCAFFDARSQTCAHEWPTALHRRAYYARLPTAAPADPEPPGPGDVVLCKEFELR
ncbi:MAG: hypothetical protein U1A78_02910 [Polyangia bacterium]